MSKNNQAVYHHPGMTATAGQPYSTNGWENWLKSVGIVPKHFISVTQPNSIEEGLIALSQGTYNGPLTEVVTRVSLNSLPQWTPELENQARQKVAWVYADAQSKGTQVQPIEVPVYDPSLPMGAHPVDIEKYIRWEQQVDMQHRFPTYEARLMPNVNNGEVPMEQRKSLFNRVTDLGQKVKERVAMDINNQNFNQPAANYAANQVQGQQQAVPQQPIPNQQMQGQPQQVIQGQQMAAQAAALMGLRPDQNGQLGTVDTMKLWMFQHPKISLAGAAAGGALVFIGGRWVWKKTLGGDSEFSDEEAAAGLEALNVVKGALGF